ncbi:MAG: MBL fold metallo-hydrolase [bacterium]|nr:MBL fold metallo-hydrolase [bacterium]
MGEILEFAERAWQGALEKTQVHPSRVSVGLEELEPGLAFVSAFSNLAALEGPDGLCFFDTSSLFHATKIFELVRHWSPARLDKAVYTHGHVDHVFGTKLFEQEASAEGWDPVEVIAHEACAARFDRYQLTNGYNAIINQRQFDFPEPVFPKRYRYPDRTLRDSLRLEVGDETVELHHDRGETDDHVWVHMPARKAIYTGDLFIWASPNCGNPQKVQRYPREWAMALRKMQKLGAERLLPGHGPPIIGADRVEQALGDSAQLIETLFEQTLSMMNDGAKLNDILHSVKLPERLLARPYLRPTYDDPYYIVRNLWRLYGGWYEGNPASLKPAADASVAQALAALSGGALAIAQRAEGLAGEGQLDVACHLIEFAANAEPASQQIHAVRAALYRERAKAELSLMGKAIYNAAARDSEAV